MSGEESAAAEPGTPVRLDRALVARGLARSRGQAAELIAAGAVLLDGTPARRPSQPVGEAADLRLAAVDPYVSRAAHKLLGALDDLALTVSGRALDAGASTGGFTQVLLERGCQEVIAVDVGHGQLAPEVRADPRVVVWERTNLRDLDLAHVGGRPVDLVVADVSFISLRLLIGRLIGVLDPAGSLLVLVKPQFEVGRERLGSGGVVQDVALRQEAVDGVIEVAAEYGWTVTGSAPSRLPGGDGNREFFVLFGAKYAVEGE